MKLRSLVTGAAILALCAGAASAATHNPRHHSNRLARSQAMNEPAQPIAYSKLDTYLKASPAEKKNGNWGLDTSTASTAATGPGSNASAMAPSGGSTVTTGAPATPEAAPSAGPANQPDQNAAPPTPNNPNGATAPNDTTTAPPNGGGH
jgi:hypothetical protein